MKVIKQFFCIQEKKTYYVGDEYTGKRTDLSQLLEAKDLSHVLKMEDKAIVPKTRTKKRKNKK